MVLILPGTAAACAVATGTAAAAGPAATVAAGPDEEYAP